LGGFVIKIVLVVNPDTFEVMCSEEASVHVIDHGYCEPECDEEEREEGSCSPKEYDYQACVVKVSND
jgi:hypothetical protein